MVRLAGPRDKNVIVHFYFWSRGEERGCQVRESYFYIESLFIYCVRKIVYFVLFKYVRIRLNF